MKKVAFSIIIPTKDEREHISTTIGSICATMIDESFEILIVYDSNKDNTLPVIRKLKQKYHQLKITKNCFLGLAGAIKTGVKKSRGKYIITLSADDSAPIQSLPMAIKLSKKYDFLSGTRYRMGGKRINGSLIGKILSEMANSLYSYLKKSSFSDLTTGFKIFKKDIFNDIDPKSEIGGGIFLEMAIKAEKLNLKVGEFPFISVDRLHGGKSSMHLFKWIKEYCKIFITEGF